jgi:hypothetical protein
LGQAIVPASGSTRIASLTVSSTLTLDLTELGARLGEAVALEEAVSVLVHHGLVDRIGDRLRASNAAVRFAELSR